MRASKKKIKSSKAVAIVAAALSAVAVGSVGFASWVISGTNVTVSTKNTLSVEVADVIDKRFTLSVDNANSDLSVRFDAQSGDTTGPIVYSADSGVTGGEDLNASIVWTLAANDKKTSISGLVTSVTAEFSSYKDISSYVVSPFTVSDDKATATIWSTTSTFTPPTGVETKVTTSIVNSNGTDSSSSDNISGAYSITCKTTFTFSWGKYFGSSNPGNYSGSDASTIDNYISGLEALKSLNSTAWGQITLTATATTAA